VRALYWWKAHAYVSCFVTVITEMYLLDLAMNVASF